MDSVIELIPIRDAAITDMKNDNVELPSDELGSEALKTVLKTIKNALTNG